MNLSTSSSRRWLRIFFAILVPVCGGYLAASEWLIRTQVTPHDNFEYISSRLRASTQPNAAFGDSHVAAVSDYDTKDFINLGIGATTIRKMDQRVRYYFQKIKPGQVIIQADPHLFAEYRLQPQGSYVPEDYSNLRLRALDPQHRGFMSSYWSAFLLKRTFTKESFNSDMLWQVVRQLLSPAASAPLAEAPAQQPESPALAQEPSDGTPPPRASEAAAEPPPDAAEMAKFNAFMDSEVATHTPVRDFRSRDEARIYRNMIDFLISRGAAVCLVNYPVDKFYRERADAIPTFGETREFYKEIARENHIPYVSFWDRFDDPSMYQNTDHVNRKGSAILAREARKACFDTPH